MKLSALISGIEHELSYGSLQKQVSGVEYDSRKVSSDSLFVAVIGFESDGHKYIESAVKSGASVIAVDKAQSVFSSEDLRNISETNDVTILVFNDTRLALALLSKNFYGKPDEELSVIGITGTKGKTTTSFMMYEIFKTLGDKSGLMGTVYNIVDGEKRKAVRTTPESKDLYEMMGELKSTGSKTAAIEISSQGLKLHRVGGLKLKAACFTNFYEDHIAPNEHPDMEDYLLSKLKIFDLTDTAVVNSDCNEADRVFEAAKTKCSKVYTYGLSDKSDCYALNIRPEIRNNIVGSAFTLVSPWYNGELYIPIPGDFNVYNALCAVCAAGICDVPFETLSEALAKVFVPGRLQNVPNELGFSCIVDYAHNAASLESVLRNLRSYTKGRIITVFGCGGNRSATRRFEMGEVSGKLSDFTVITSDNPRDEDPELIIGNIVTGIERTDGKYITVIDRKEAIRKALSEASKDDLVLIAGKGHEDYQIFANKRTIHFDDYETASEIVSELSLERK